jgi:hypothetical protein
MNEQIIEANKERWLTNLPKHDIIVTREGNFFLCEGETYTTCTQKNIVSKFLEQFQLVVIFDFYVDGHVFGFVIQDDEYIMKIIIQDYITKKALVVTVKNDDVFTNEVAFRAIMGVFDNQISDACLDFIQLSIMKIVNCKMREFFKMKQLEKESKEKRKSLYN